MSARSLRLRRPGKWPLLLDGEFHLSVQSPTKLIDRPQGLWRKLPMFWQVQLVGWGVFAVVDLISQRLIFHDFLVASLRTALIVASLIVISAAMRSVYASHRLEKPPDPACRHLDDVVIRRAARPSWRRWPSPAASWAPG